MPQPLTFCPAETTPLTKATYTALYVPPTGITSCVPPLTVIKADVALRFTRMKLS